jgi:hypothetical protein
MGTHELWMGAVSDTEYMLRSGIYEQQFEFVTKRDKMTNHVPWLNMFDCGYRNIGDYAQSQGIQLFPGMKKCSGLMTLCKVLPLLLFEQAMKDQRTMQNKLS